MTMDIGTLKVRELKQYLRERGAHVSGSKTELLERARGVQTLCHRTIRDIEAQDHSESEARQLYRFTTPLGERIPEPWNLKNGWDSDIETFPCVTQNDLYNYLVLSKNRTFDSQSMKAKRQLKARVFYHDGHVHTVRYNEILKDCSHCFIKSKVIPSLPGGSKENQKPDYDTWVCMSKITGRIHSAGCTCSAGEGEACNHIAALLYALVDVSDKRKDGLTASTSTTCQWNKPRKRKLSPTRSQDMIFKRNKFTEDKLSKSKMSKREDTLNSVTKVDIGQFVTRLQEANPTAAFLWSLPSHNKDKSTNETELESFHHINMMYCDYSDLKSASCQVKFSNYFDELAVDEKQCELIETTTKGQNNNQVWKWARQGRITSSNFGPVYKLRDTTSPDCTVSRIMDYSDFDCESLRWGRTHEPAARRVYQKIILKKHPKMKVHCSGLVVNPSMPHLGCSPDAMLTCNHCEDCNGVLEIKCPYVSRFLSPMEAAENQSFFCEIVDGQLKLKKNHNYYFQIQGQMGVSKRNWCDFFVWTLKGYSVERIEFDKQLWNKMYVKITSFFKDNIIPELHCERVKRGKKLFPNE